MSKELVTLAICVIGIISPIVYGFYSEDLTTAIISSTVSVLFLAVFMYVILSKP